MALAESVSKLLLAASAYKPRLIVVTWHFMFAFRLLLIFLKICCFLHWIQSVNPHFLLPYIIMDLPLFVIAEWATLLVDIRCPRGGS